MPLPCSWSFGGLARPPVGAYAAGDCVQLFNPTSQIALFTGAFKAEDDVVGCTTVKDCPSYATSCVEGECGCSDITLPTQAKPVCVKTPPPVLP
jgi:hypothetical protein